MHPQQLETEKKLCISGPNAVFFLILYVVHCHNEGGTNMLVSTSSPTWCGQGLLDGSGAWCAQCSLIMLSLGQHPRRLLSCSVWAFYSLPLAFNSDTLILHLEAFICGPGLQIYLPALSFLFFSWRKMDKD